MEIAEHTTAIAREARLLAEAARRGGLEADIETCPGWAMRDLVRHLSEIHLWAAAHVSLRATKMWVDDLSDLSGYWPDLAVFWPEDGDLVDWYLETNANLVRELDSAPADLDAMTFLPAPSARAMWARRQAHETAVHRFDAEHATGTPPAFDPVFAADGIDEMLAAFAPRGSTFPIPATKTMAVSPTDADHSWLVTMAPDGITTVSDYGPADVTLAGSASDIYLALWNRGDSPDIAITGDRDVLEAWHTGHRIRWS
ncbi:maleylpyruvate isomerase family mycothiol-dependent enzyme [bacterium]|nr:maleylpyruvate isomerase family mycothiol-dependent enzyme [bacterium]